MDTDGKLLLIVDELAISIQTREVRARSLGRVFVMLQEQMRLFISLLPLLPWLCPV